MEIKYSYNYVGTFNSYITLSNVLHQVNILIAVSNTLFVHYLSQILHTTYIALKFNGHYSNILCMNYKDKYLFHSTIFSFIPMSCTCNCKCLLNGNQTKENYAFKSLLLLLT